MVGNIASILITHIGTLSTFPNIQLLDILVVPHLTKDLLSISKLTFDFPTWITLTNNLRIVQNRQTGRVVVIGKSDRGLQVLGRNNSPFIYILKINLYVVHMIYGMFTWVL